MPTEPLKEIILGVLMVAAHILLFSLWRAVMPLITAQAYGHYMPFIFAIAAIVAAALLFSFAVLFIKRTAILYLTVVASLIVPFLYLQVSRGSFTLMVLCILLGLFAIRRMRTELIFSVGFSIARIFRAGLPYYFTVLSLILSLYYFTELGHAQNISDIVPIGAFDITFRIIGGPLKAVTGADIRTNATVDDFIEDIIRDQIKKQGSGLDGISASEMKRLVALQRTELANRYHITLTGKESLSGAFRMTVAERVEDILGPYRAYLPYASAIAFFLGMKTVTLPLYFLTLLLTFLLIKLLIWSNIIGVKKIQIEVERIEM